MAGAMLLMRSAQASSRGSTLVSCGNLVSRQ
jgi:hypothetical protein